MAQRESRRGVFIYLILFDPLLKEPQFDKASNAISLPGKNSLIPGALNSTILAMRLIHNAKLAGHDAKVFYRTNLSTFTRFGALLKYMAPWTRKSTPFYGGYLISNLPTPTPFIGGFAIIMNRPAYEKLLSHAHRLKFSLIDDVAIGLLMNQLRIQPIDSTTSCLAEWTKDVSYPSLKVKNCDARRAISYRIKFDSQKPLCRYRDVQLWSHLFEKYYLGEFAKGKDVVNFKAKQMCSETRKPC